MAFLREGNIHKLGGYLSIFLLMSMSFWAGTLVDFSSVTIHTQIVDMMSTNRQLITNEYVSYNNKPVKFSSPSIISTISFNIRSPTQINQYLTTYKSSNQIIMDLAKKTSRDIYMNYHNMFCNGCDFGPLWSITKALCTNNLNFSMFIVGANYGGSTNNILTACQEAINTTINPNIYAFEAIPEIFAAFKQKFTNPNKYKNTKNLHVFNNALSNENNKSVPVVSDLGGGGGLHSGYKEDKMLPRGMVETMTFDYILKHQHNGKTVDYVLIDVEGFEVNVVWGMKLEENYMKFPMFQIELGGTWVDERHSTDWTQGDIAKYLEGLGYDLFLMGGDKSWTHFIGNGDVIDIRGCPKLLRVYSEMFYDKRVMRGDTGGCIQGFEYVQGNLMAVHLEYVRDEIKEVIYGKLRELQLEVFKHMEVVNYTQPHVRPMYIY